MKKYMPDAPAAWDKMTVFNLLTHTSGIPSFTGFPDYASTGAIPATPEKLVARFRDKPLEFQPGEKWNYSNSGYVLLGYLIEKISGQPYAKFVQENIFDSLSKRLDTFREKFQGQNWDVARVRNFPSFLTPADHRGQRRDKGGGSSRYLLWTPVRSSCVGSWRTRRHGAAACSCPCRHRTPAVSVRSASTHEQRTARGQRTLFVWSADSQPMQILLAL